MERGRLNLVSLAVLAALAATVASAEEAVQVTGDVIESSYKIRMGARGESQHTCAEGCAARGGPITLLEDWTDRVVRLGEKDHVAGPNRKLVPYIAEKVSLFGQDREQNGTRLPVISKLKPARNF